MKPGILGRRYIGSGFAFFLSTQSCIAEVESDSSEDSSQDSSGDSSDEEMNVEEK